MTNKEWINLFSKEWQVSHRVAKDMLHAMFEIVGNVNYEKKQKESEVCKKCYFRHICKNKEDCKFRKAAIE